ncbi:GTP-binding protein of Nug1 family isoform 1 [Galdieria sulphuraria]|uniref:GTP-binding protein of Nug1 family isoform 1 n=1 Tax=Galdieria sulphuraria TaxID=130081 RepID=M2Y0F6_GALSU|nr:GTP-binding protein of Nug1 family isoform 1 [Galdieria sulphuraria]EME29378.1 GTP-binding protein of Nug1 family isoform 1 [Galdieria sulphuraria]|eukprot:XP_005705898.1 GTP-binding protein of Nug1 family isoform 1 [Galdieria sulphuraria]
MAPHSKSKRMTLRKKYKIQRKVREHKRKMRKQQKKQSRTKKHEKELRIPNAFPYKEQILEEYAKQEQTLKRIRLANKLKATAVTQEDNSQDREEQITTQSSLEDTQVEAQVKGNIRRHVKDFKQLVNQCDIILQVIDARDPLGTRSMKAEQYIMSNFGGSKRIVLVLNKVDMIPNSIATQWIEYLSTFHPTVPFCAAHEKIRKKYTPHTESLMRLLKGFLSDKHHHHSSSLVMVGVVGYPNVGKSSLINCLHRSQVVETGPNPGVTKHNQEIVIDQHIRFMDCPGIVFMSHEEDHHLSLVIRNFVSTQNVEDPFPFIDAIIDKVGVEKLTTQYNIPIFSTRDEFLALIAKKRGKLQKGGALDLQAAAHSILIDWSRGKIPYYTSPPKDSSAQVSACVVETYDPPISTA